MAIIRLTDDLFEKFTLVTNPRKTFASSSSGVTGSVFLYARSSNSVKEVFSLGNTGSYDDSNLEESRQRLKDEIAREGRDAFQAADLYLAQINSTDATKLNSKKLNITQFFPPFTFQSGTLKKSAIVNVSIPAHRVQ